MIASYCPKPTKNVLLALHYSCQPTCDRWVLVVFRFMLDLSVANARTILKYNKENYINSRRNFLKNLAAYLTILT